MIFCLRVSSEYAFIDFIFGLKCSTRNWCLKCKNMNYKDKGNKQLQSALFALKFSFFQSCSGEMTAGRRHPLGGSAWRVTTALASADKEEFIQISFFIPLACMERHYTCLHIFHAFTHDCTCSSCQSHPGPALNMRREGIKVLLSIRVHIMWRFPLSVAAFPFSSLNQSFKSPNMSFWW